MKLLIGTAEVALLAYLTVAAVLYFLQDRLLFLPRPLDKEVKRLLSSHEIAVQSGDVRLAGWFVKGEITEERPLIFYFGGNAEEVSGNLFSIGRIRTSSFLFMNYRGYGESEGSPTQDALYADAVKIYDEIVRKTKVPPQRIVLMGRSLGSGVAVYLASKRPVGGLILITAYDTLVNVAESHYPIFPVKWLMRHPFDSLRLAPNIKAPVLNLMAGNDSIIPNRFSRNLMKHWGGKSESVLIQGASHNDISQYDRYWEAINRFLASRR